MAIVNVDLSEYDAIRKRNSELEEQVKELKKMNESLKGGSKVILRKETTLLFHKHRAMWDYDDGDDEPQRKTIESSESYVNFEDVRLKVEEQMKDEIYRSIKQRDASRESYESSVQKYKEKEKKLDDKEKSLNDEYAKKEAALISEYKEKEKALEADYIDKGKAYKRQLEADYKNYKNQAGRLPLINKNAKEALSLLNANRFFKPKGVESILAQIIQKCEQ